MNPITLIFKDKELETNFNKQEETVLLDKVFQVIVAFIITTIIGMYFWFRKGNLLFAFIQVFLILQVFFIYYFLIYKQRFKQYIPLVLLNFSVGASGFQLLINLMELEISQKELSLLQDAVMLSMFSYQIHNNFILNTFQYTLYITCRIYISFTLNFALVISLTFIFSILIIHNDYVRIKAMRNRFLLQLYNSNQLKMLENLEQPILVLEFQEDTQRLVQFFVNNAFINKIISMDIIQFIKNCQVEKKESLYTVLAKRIEQQGSLRQLQVKFENIKYQVNSEIYKGQRMLVALEFIKITQKNVQAQPYFYQSLLNYVRKHNKHQYRIEIMKNLCGFLLYRPNQLKLQIQQVSIIKIIRLADPLLIQSNIDEEEYCKSNFQLLSLFFYIVSKCFKITKLNLTRKLYNQEKQFRFQIVGNLNGKYYTTKQLTQKVNLLSIIIRLIGLDDFSFKINTCRFTLINLEEQFLIL